MNVVLKEIILPVDGFKSSIEHQLRKSRIIRICIVFSLITSHFLRIIRPVNSKNMVERNIAHKYKRKESIFRMKKRACDYGSQIIQNRLKFFNFFFYKVDDIFFRDSFQLSTYVISFFIVVFTFN